MAAPALPQGQGDTDEHEEEQAAEPSARAELAVGGAVLLVTAILVATPTPLDGMP